MKLADIVLFGVLGFTSCYTSRQTLRQELFSSYPKSVQTEVGFYTKCDKKSKQFYELKCMTPNCISIGCPGDSSSFDFLNTYSGWWKIYRCKVGCKDSVSITPITQE